jgi:hypothetical protein
MLRRIRISQLYPPAVPFFKTLWAHCTGHAIFDVLGNYQTSKRREWEKCAVFTTAKASVNSAPLMNILPVLILSQ